MAENIKICPICSSKFVAYSTQKYCSKKCYYVSKIRYGGSRYKSGKKTKNNSDLVDIDRLAREEGLTYGQYVAKYGL